MATRYWYNLTTGTVQTDSDKGQGKNLMGPYASEEEARHALEAARARTEAWDEDERRWREGDDQE